MKRHLKQRIRLHSSHDHEHQMNDNHDKQRVSPNSVSVVAHDAAHRQGGSTLANASHEPLVVTAKSAMQAVTPASVRSKTMTAVPLASHWMKPSCSPYPVSSSPSGLVNDEMLVSPLSPCLHAASSPLSRHQKSQRCGGHPENVPAIFAKSNHRPSPDPLADDLSKLTLQEQEIIEKDVTGQLQVIDEEPIFVAERLKRMRENISVSRKKAAYDKAAFLSPRYVRNEKFLLMFLRADRFNPARAALRVIDHFEQKLNLFGSERLVRKIMLKDLDDDDKATLLTGYAQMYRKDKFGRLVFCIVHKYGAFRTVENKERVFWYTFMSKMEDDVESQRNGTTVVVYTLGCTANDFYNAVTRTSNRNLDKAMPIRICALHVCFEDPSLRPLFSFIIAPRLKATRLRIRIHFGSDLECQYALNSFGIPTAALPVNQHGKIDTVAFCRRLDQLQQAELQAEERERKDRQNDGLIACPTSQDILLGRGIPYQTFPGNCALAALVEVYKSQHDGAARSAKTAISEEIVRRLKDGGSRFLKRHDNGDWWIEVTDDTGREKVAMGFRNLSRKRKHGTIPP